MGDWGSKIPKNVTTWFMDDPKCASANFNDPDYYTILVTQL